MPQTMKGQSPGQLRRARTMKLVWISDRPERVCSTSILNFSTGSKLGRPPLPPEQLCNAFLSTGRNISKSSVAASYAPPVSEGVQLLTL